MLPVRELSLPVTMKVRERGGKEEEGRERKGKKEREGEGCREEGRGRKGEKERERERDAERKEGRGMERGIERGGKKGGKERKRKKSRSSHVMFMTKDDTGTWMSGKFSRGISFLTQSDSAHKVGLA